MKKITLSGSISVEEFERKIMSKSKEKNFDSLFASNAFLVKLNKDKRKFVVAKTGKYGIGRERLYFYAKYEEQNGKTVIVGKFDLPLTLKLVMMSSLAITAAILIIKNSMSIPMAALIFGGGCLFLSKAPKSTSYIRSACKEIISFLQEILSAEQ